MPGQILIAANRLPVSIRIEGGSVEVTPSSGGLASAMRPIHEGGGSRWIGWPGDLGRLDDGDRGRVDGALRERGLIPVELSAAEVTRYYDNFANGVLWPLFHYLTERLRLDATPDWNAYREVNERFAATIAEAWRPGDRVWIHDYHLMLVPQMLRRLVPDARIGFFLHIPFPAAEVFRLLPWREPLLRGLLAADLLGFHTAEYAHHFRYAANQLIGVEDLGDDLVFEDHRVHVGAYPIGIDTAHFVELAGRAEVAEQTAVWRKRVDGQRMVVGVDRLDYTKGLGRRLVALERLFERWPSWRERLIFVQLAVPTREKVDEYASFRRDIHELVGRINGRFGTPGWAPIHFLHRSVSNTELVALYRAADVMLVTPLRDGMNLVAKEFCATRTDDRGVLVLSELAGAAAELREALLVNPYDIEATAGTIRRALAMSTVEQQARMKALRATVTGNDVHGWADRLLGDLAKVSPTSAELRAVDPARAPLTAELATLRAAPRRVLLLDYDGTLVPFASMPELAFPDDDLRALLGALASSSQTAVHVVSGRSRASLDAWLGDLAIGLHAEHGFWSRWPGQSWTSVMTAAPVELAGIDLIMSEVARRTPGGFVERKGASLAWHYRMAEPLLAARRLDELRRKLAESLPPMLELLDGAKVLEVRVRGADKAAVGRRIVEAALGDGEPALLAIGDDRTDEDLFAAMPRSAVTVRVGPGATRARHRVGGPDDVRALLRGLL